MPSGPGRRLVQPLKWHGGKRYLADKLVALMPPHIHYVEPFAGGLAVLLAKDPEGCSEVVNDVNRRLTNFWNVLKDDVAFSIFERIVQAIPFSEPEWNIATRGGLAENPVEEAVAFFVNCRQSLAGRRDAFAAITRARTRRGMNEQAAAWLGAVDGLREVHYRLRRVVILDSRDAVEVITSEDGPETLFYLDPPYLHETRATTGEYEHEMTREQHRLLLASLVTIDGKFMLSGYPSPLYDEFAAREGWPHVDFDVPNSAAGGDEKRRMVERVWCNFEPKIARVITSLESPKRERLA